MAARFRCDPQVAGEVSRELAGIRSSLAGSGRIADGSEQSTGSAKVGAALEKFFADSSDSRENMDALLERAAGLLQGLAEGTTAVDKGLADALEPAEAAPAGGPR